jgi:hypothetical protein
MTEHQRDGIDYSTEAEVAEPAVEEAVAEAPEESPAEDAEEAPAPEPAETDGTA